MDDGKSGNISDLGPKEPNFDSVQRMKEIVQRNRASIDSDNQSYTTPINDSSMTQSQNLKQVEPAPRIQQIIINNRNSIDSDNPDLPSSTLEEEKV